MLICKVCSKEFDTKQKLGGHMSSHFRGDTYRQKREGNPKEIKIPSTTCKFCNKQFVKYQQVGSHMRLCRLNPDFDKNVSKIQTNRQTKVWTSNERQRKSEIMKRVVEQNPDSYLKNNVVGRVKNVDYNGVKLKGSWELLVAKWLDSKAIKWEHETKSFKYEWNGIRTYYPDFYLPELNLFLEVKGYQRDRDLAKWKVVPNLVVFRAKEINQIKKGIEPRLVHIK